MRRIGLLALLLFACDDGGASDAVLPACDDGLRTGDVGART